MPLDTSIPFRGTPVRVASPIEQYSKILGIREAQGNLQAQQQQFQANQERIDTATAQREAAARETARAAQEEEVIHSALERNGFSPTKALAEVGKGVRVKTYLDFKKSADEEAKAAHELAKKDPEALKLREYQDARKAEIIAAALKDPNYVQNYPNYIADFTAIDPEAKLPEQPIPQDQLRSYGVRFGVGAALSKEASDKAGLAKTTADAAKAQTEAEVAAATKAGTIAAAPNATTGIKPSEQLTANATAARDTQTQKNQEAQRKIDEERLGIERGSLNLRIKENQQKTQGSLGVLSDAQKALAQKVADGDLTVAQLSRLPDKEAIVAGAIELNPEWSSNTAQTKKAFTDPASKQSQNLGTISRIVGHIDRFETNSKDLGLSPSLLIGQSLTGKAAATAEDAHAISSELEKLVSGGVGTVGQVKAWQEALLSSRQGIRQAAIDEISQLIGSQFEGMNQTYKGGTGKNLPLEQFTTPAAKKWLKSQGIDVTGSGGAPAISSEAEYNKLKSGDKFMWNGKEGTKP